MLVFYMFSFDVHVKILKRGLNAIVLWQCFCNKSVTLNTCCHKCFTQYWFTVFVVKTFSAILKKTTKRKTFFVTIKHNDNDHRKKMLLYSDITDCLNLLTAFVGILGGV